jgi:stage V sporulation protein R
MSLLRSRPIDGELLRLKEEIEAHAVKFGLDFYPVIFEVCDYDTINILAAQGGFPARYPHWRFGMDYDQMHKGYTYGMQKIYEMVINTSPVYAYLLNANHMVDQKIVMSHVFGHADFFKHNAWFKQTNRSMMDVMANHGTKIRRYMERYGQETVEDFIDCVLSLENLIDPDVLFLSDDLFKKRSLGVDAEVDSGASMDDHLAPALRSFMRAKSKEENHKKGTKKANSKDTEDEDESGMDHLRLPSLPTRDILWFLMNYAPLKEWQTDIIGILRDEAYYFLPQRMTKIMNEGWASYWHSTIMTQKVLKASEVIDFADHHAGVMAMSPKQLNPYKIGIELFRDIEYRWDTGKFGKEYNECESLYERENWDKKTMLGREKIFEVRKTHNDITFIDEFLTPEFCQRMQIFTYKFNPRTGRNEIDTRDFEAIKSKLLNQLSNFGSPLIEVVDANYGNKGELLLQHRHQGVDLDVPTGSETMRNIYRLWKRPINLLSQQEGKTVSYRFDGRQFLVE